MKMQRYKLCFVLMLIIVSSTLVIAGDIIVQDGELKLEGEFDIVSDGNSTTFISETGGSLTIDEPLNKIELDEDSLEKAEINIEKNEISQDNSEINSEEQSPQEKSSPITGAVIGSKSKNYVVPILIILIAIVGIFIGLIMWRKKYRLN